MTYPAEYKYTKDHEWAKLMGSVLTIGITDHAQSSLGDIVFVELPEVGADYKKGDTFGVVESVKAVSDLFMPASGKVKERNDALVDNPSMLNESPHDSGWMLKIELTDSSELSDLMSSGDYEKFASEQA